MTFSPEVILQTVMTAVLLACGGAIWKTSLAIAGMTAAFKAHEKLDDERHATLVAALTERR